MTGRQAKPNITSAAAKLRNIIWSAEDGHLLGSEEDLTGMLGVSRPTVRQVARLLEREGLLRVRRGINGGYFAARPSVEVIEGAVSAYLEMMEADDEELSEIASALWVIVVGKAAKLPVEAKTAVLESLKSKVRSLRDDALFDDMLAVEEAGRKEIFKLINSPYIELIFHINRSSAVRKFPLRPGDRDSTEEHSEFIKVWRTAKLLELEAIMAGDRTLAELAGRYTRDIFHKRLWGRGYR